MSVTVGRIINEMEKIAPRELAADWDNSGLIIGDRKHDVMNALIALDITSSVIDEAVNKNVQIIISHHPLIFSPLKSVCADDYTGEKVIRLIENRIAVYSAHTNLDASDYGTNEILCRLIGLTEIEPIIYDGLGAMGRVGRLTHPIKASELAKKLKNVLNCEFIRLSGNTDSVIEKVAVCAGSGSKASYYKEAAAKGCQCYITGDTRFHELQEASVIGLCVIDATHYATELPVVQNLCGLLNSAFASDGILFLQSEINGQVYKNI